MTEQAQDPRSSPRRRRIPLRLVRALAAFGVLLFVTVVWVFVHEYRLEWRLWQSRFDRVESTIRGERPAAAAADSDERGIQQIWVQDLDRVDRCTTCHLAVTDADFAEAPPPFRSHPGGWLETHRPERFGCTACHSGQGEATTYRDAAHRAIPHWADPMRSPELMEANCGTCHRERRPEKAHWLARGRALVAASNCSACHDIPGFGPADVRAPRLDSEGLKVAPAWLRGWLKDPRSYLPASRMANFRLAPAEVEGLVAFLGAQRAQPLLDTSTIDWRRASAERGGALFRGARCVTCHSVDGRGGQVGPALTTVASKVTREALFSFLKDPHRYQPDTLMPHFRFSDDEIRDLVAYGLEEWVDPTAGRAASASEDPGAPAVAAGREVFVRRGCYACHPLPDLAPLAKIGPKQAGLGDRVVDMAFLEQQSIEPSLPNWIFTKLRAPETMSRAARMPTFGFSPDEAGAITVALLSLRARELPAARVTADPPTSPYDPQGAFGALVRRYRCLSCHTVNGYGGTLSTVALDRIGSQLRREHIESFLRNPFAIRVSLAERMPRLNLTEAEARLVADYLATVFVDDSLGATLDGGAAGVERGRALFETLGCRGCHIVGARGGYVGPDLNGAGLRLTPGWTKAWLLAPQKWRPGTLEPDYGLSPQQAEDLTRFLMTLRRSPTASAGGAR